MSHDATNDKTDRRSALRLLTWGGVAAVGCALAAPAAIVIAAPLASTSGGKSQWVKTLPLTALPEGTPKKVKVVSARDDAWTRETDVELGAVWLVRKGDAIVAFSAVCPHLGCAIDAKPDGTYNCPCHDSDFTASGACTSGPSPRGLDPLATRIDDGYVSIDFKRFKVGTPDRIAIG